MNYLILLECEGYSWRVESLKKYFAKGCRDTFINPFDLLVSVKIVGTLYWLLALPMLV